MASARKPRIMNRRSGKATDGATEKDEGGGTYKNRQRKRKLSDMLGPQWSKEELEHFYEAYRKYGKDWKKVAATIRNRTIEMVEGLYNMNRAYLSLPDGTASTAGLIAMMIDHYNMLEGSNSDRDSTDEFGVPGKPQKQTRLKQKPSSMNNFDGGYSDLLHCRSGPSNYGCSSPVKKRRSGGSRPRVVGKRTPRFPVSHTLEKQKPEAGIQRKREPDSDGDHDDYEVAKVVALTLAEASQRAASPQISRTPSRITEQMRPSPVQNGDLKGSYIRNESAGSGAKLTGSAMDEGGLEVSQESREVGNGVITKVDSAVLKGETGAEVANNMNNKVKKPLVNKLRSQGLEHVHCDDVKEECSCTEEGTGLKEEKDELLDIESADGKRRKRPLSHRSRKRSRQLFTRDENIGLDALATLADLSLNGLLPSPTVESVFDTERGQQSQDSRARRSRGGRSRGGISHSIEKSEDSSVQVKEETRENAELEKAEKAAWEANVADLQEEKPRIFWNRERGSAYKVSINNVESVKERRDEGPRNAELEGQYVSSGLDLKKRKRKPTVEALGESCSGKMHKLEALLGDGPNFRNKPKRMTNTQTLSKHGRSLKPLQSSSSDPEAAGGVTAESMVQNTAINQVSLPTKLRSRRKMPVEKALVSKTAGCPDNDDNIIVNEQSETLNIATMFWPHDVTDRASSMKVKLTHCLSSAKLRRWCTYEWFYSAIDLPWFAQNEFVEYLNHAGLGHVPRLTRVEWGVIRSSLGKPRRLSKRFLQEEREKLEQYRESVRQHYNEVRAGIREGLPTDLARPLSVGQRVIGCHPKTREIHDGNILTVDRNRCRVQFDRPELGVEFVLDIDCMPLNPLENMPEELRRKTMVLDSLGRTFEDSKFEVMSKGMIMGSGARASLNERLDKQGSGQPFVTPATYSFNTLLKQAKLDTVDSVIQAKAAANEVAAATQQAMYNQPCTLAQIQTREADIRALSDLTRALDKKEALLVELRHMNDEVGSNWKNGEAMRDSESFRKQYATVLCQLRDANDQVASALVYLRQRNTYQENSVPPWHCAMPLSIGSGGLSSSDPCGPISLDVSPQIGEIVNNSKRRAIMMVQTAMQAMSSLKEGEDALTKIGGALETFACPHAGVDSGNVGVKLGSSQFDSSRGAEQETLNLCESGTASFGPQLTQDNVPDANQKGFSDRREVPLPSELIASCVATLLMIQICTERQYPPSDVAQMLDNAITSLQPYSTQNLVIYREIQQSMGIVKNQILALIPTQPNISVSSELPTASK